MALNRFLNLQIQQNYYKALKWQSDTQEVPCYLCNLPVSLTRDNTEATKFYAKVCYMKCVDRSLKYATVESTVAVATAEPTIVKFESVSIDVFQTNIIRICELAHAAKHVFDQIIYLNTQQDTKDDLVYFKLLKYDVGNAKKTHQLLIDLDIVEGDMKNKLRRLYELVAPFDGDLQMHRDDGHSYDSFDSNLCELALCAFIGNSLFKTTCRWIKYDDWKSILFSYNDIYSIHHDHFSGAIYGAVHKRCNSKVRIGTPEQLTINVYAHFGSFDFSFLLRGIDINTLLNIQMNKQTIKLIGAGANRFDYMILGNLFFKDSMKMFPSLLADLCTTKTEDECKTMSDMLYKYLTQGSEYFKSVYTTTDPLTNKVSVDERWQSLFMS